MKKEIFIVLLLLLHACSFGHNYAQELKDRLQEDVPNYNATYTVKYEYHRGGAHSGSTDIVKNSTRTSTISGGVCNCQQQGYIISIRDHDHAEGYACTYVNEADPLAATNIDHATKQAILKYTLLWESWDSQIAPLRKEKQGSNECYVCSKENCIFCFEDKRITLAKFGYNWSGYNEVEEIPYKEIRNTNCEASSVYDDVSDIRIFD